LKIQSLKEKNVLEKLNNTKTLKLNSALLLLVNNSKDGKLKSLKGKNALEKLNNIKTLKLYNAFLLLVINSKGDALKTSRQKSALEKLNSTKTLKLYNAFLLLVNKQIDILKIAFEKLTILAAKPNELQVAKSHYTLAMKEYFLRKLMYFQSAKTNKALDY